MSLNEWLQRKYTANASVCNERKEIFHPLRKIYLYESAKLYKMTKPNETSVR